MPPPLTSLTSSGTSFILGAPSTPPTNLDLVYQPLVNACGGQMLLNASHSSTTRFTVSHSMCLTYATVLLEHGVACFPPGFWRAKQAAITSAIPELALPPPSPPFPSALCIGFSTLSVCCALQLLYFTAVPTTCFSCGLYNILIWAGQSACPMTLCCLLVCHCMFRAGRVDVDVKLEQVCRGCMESVGRSVFSLCILVPFGGSGK